nr:myb-like protein D [Dermatophagoides farinae]
MNPIATMAMKITNTGGQSSLSSLNSCIDDFDDDGDDNNNEMEHSDQNQQQQQQQQLSDCDDLFNQYRLECEKWLLDDSLIASIDQQKYVNLLRNMVKDLLDQNECLVSNIMEIKQESANRINELRRNLENTAARTEEVMLSLESHELCLKNFVQQHCCECCACDMRLLEFKLCHGPYCDQLYNHPENISSNPLQSPCWSFGHLWSSVVHQTSHWLTNKESSSSSSSTNCLHNLNSEMRFMNLVKLIDKKIQQFEMENQQLRKENEIIRELNSLLNCRNGIPLMLNEWRHNNYSNRKLSYNQRTENVERNYNYNNSFSNSSSSYHMDSPSISSTSSSSLCLSPNVDRDPLNESGGCGGGGGGSDVGSQTTSMLMMMMNMMHDDGDDIQELIHDKYYSTTTTTTTTSMTKNNTSMVLNDEMEKHSSSDQHNERNDCSLEEERMINSFFNLDSKTMTIEMANNVKNDHHLTNRQNTNNENVVYCEEICDSCRHDNDSGCSTDLIPSQTDMQSLLTLSDLDYDMDQTNNIDNSEHTSMAGTNDDEQQRMVMMMRMSSSSSGSMNSSLPAMSIGSSTSSQSQHSSKSKDNDITRNSSSSYNPNNNHNYFHQNDHSLKHHHTCHHNQENHNHDQNYDGIKERDKSFCGPITRGKMSNGDGAEIEQLRIRVNLADRLIPKLYGKLLYYMNQRNLVLSQFRQENRLREKCKQDLSELTECLVDNVDYFEKRSSTILAPMINNNNIINSDIIKNKNVSDQQKISCL